jgi:hypothetical protein
MMRLTDAEHHPTVTLFDLNKVVSAESEADEVRLFDAAVIGFNTSDDFWHELLLCHA